MKKNLIKISLLLSVILGIVIFNLPSNKQVNKVDSNKFAFYVDGVQTDVPPSKGIGFVLDKYECSDEFGKYDSAVVTWNNLTWSASISNIKLKGLTCNLYFVKQSIITVSDLKNSINNNKITPPSYNGYKFDGYYTNENGNGTKVVDSEGNVVSNISDLGDDTKLYANLIPKVYKVYYVTMSNPGGRLGLIRHENVVFYVKHGVGFYTDVEATTPFTKFNPTSQAGKVFGGFYTKSGGEGIKVIDEQGNIVLNNTDFANIVTNSTSDGIDGSLTIYPLWTNNSLLPSTLKVGDKVNYTVTGSLDYLSTWVVIKEGANPELVSEKTTTDGIKLQGNNGFYNGVGTIKEKVDSYGNVNSTTNEYVKSVRNVGYNSSIPSSCNAGDCDSSFEGAVETGTHAYDQDIELIRTAMGTLKAKNYNNEEKDYWLSSRIYIENGLETNYGIAAVSNGVVESKVIYKTFGCVSDDGECETAAAANDYTAYIRPIITLNEDAPLELVDNSSGYNNGSTYKIISNSGN